MNQTAALIAATPVPFDAAGDVDVAGHIRLLTHLKASGIEAIFAAGTTGEFIGLTDDERATVLAGSLEVFGPDHVYAHVGAPTARQAERLTAQAVTLGARRLAAITPYYLPAGPRALVDYYRAVAAAAGDAAEIFVYLYAARSTATVTPAQLAELATIPGIVGAKISGESTATVMEYVRAVPNDFIVYSGNDIEFATFVRAGGNGGVAGISSVFPRPFVAMAAALRSGDAAAADLAQEQVNQAVHAVAGADLALVKAGLAMQGLPAGRTRVACDEPSESQLATLRAAVDNLT